MRRKNCAQCVKVDYHVGKAGEKFDVSIESSLYGPGWQDLSVAFFYCRGTVYHVCSEVTDLRRSQGQLFFSNMDDQILHSLASPGQGIGGTTTE